jgi:carbon-monoxide dehydrogenase medium subunit
VIPAPFEYVRAETLEEALAALSDPDAKALAGGHSLIPAMKIRLARPSVLVDLSALDLRGCEVTDEHVRFGALTTYAEVVSRLEDAPGADALSEAAAAIGDVQVRNAGTIGGGLAHADPASDIAAAAIALGGQVRLSSAAGERALPVEDFLLGPFTTAIASQELLVSVTVTRTGVGEGSAYVSVEDQASGYPLAGVAAWVARDGDRIAACTIGATGFLSVPGRLSAVEALVVADGPAVAKAALADALAGVEIAVDDVPYRRGLAAVAASRAVARAYARAGAGS